MDIDRRFAARMRAVRKFRRMQSTELAERVGLAVSTISRIELGHRRLTLENAVAICAALGVSLDEMVAENRLILPVEFY